MNTIFITVHGIHGREPLAVIREAMILSKNIDTLVRLVLPNDKALPSNTITLYITPTTTQTASELHKVYLSLANNKEHNYGLDR